METSWISELGLIDLLAVIYLIYGMVRGFMRGLSGELARLIGMVVVLVLGWQYYDDVGLKLMEISRLDEQGAKLAAFLLILGVGGLGTILVRWILRNLAEFTFKEPLEKVGGIVAGFFRCGAWVAVVVIAAIVCPSEYLNRKFGEESKIGSLVLQHVLPAYQRLAEDKPELGLPEISEDEMNVGTGGDAEQELPEPEPASTDAE